MTKSDKYDKKDDKYDKYNEYEVTQARMPTTVGEQVQGRI